MRPLCVTPQKDLNIQVADNVAEEIKLQIGSVSRLGMHGDMLVRGRDQITGLPTALRMTSRDTMRAMGNPYPRSYHASVPFSKDAAGACGGYP